MATEIKFYDIIHPLAQAKRHEWRKMVCPHDKPALGHCAFIACPNYRGNCPEHMRK